MIDFIKCHEQYVQSLLDAAPTREMLVELLQYHDKQISRMQHERLAHLITMMFVCLFFLLSFGFTLIRFVLPHILLTSLLLILTTAYIFHYYRLENAVQRWYGISNRIRFIVMDLNKK